jgi:hypothetical protein
MLDRALDDYATQAWAVAAAEMQKLIHDPLELFTRAVRLVLWLMLLWVPRDETGLLQRLPKTYSWATTVLYRATIWMRQRIASSNVAPERQASCLM